MGPDFIRWLKWKLNGWTSAGMIHYCSNFYSQTVVSKIWYWRFVSLFVLASNKPDGIFKFALIIIQPVSVYSSIGWELHAANIFNHEFGSWHIHKQRLNTIHIKPKIVQIVAFGPSTASIILLVACWFQWQCQQCGNMTNIRKLCVHRFGTFWTLNNNFWIVWFGNFIAT